MTSSEITKLVIAAIVALLSSPVIIKLLERGKVYKSLDEITRKLDLHLKESANRNRDEMIFRLDLKVRKMLEMDEPFNPSCIHEYEVLRERAKGMYLGEELQSEIREVERKMRHERQDH